jgi:hypothetical protein
VHRDVFIVICAVDQLLHCNIIKANRSAMLQDELGQQSGQSEISPSNRPPLLRAFNLRHRPEPHQEVLRKLVD